MTMVSIQRVSSRVHYKYSGNWRPLTGDAEGEELVSTSMVT